MMNLVQNPTDALYRNRALVILLLLGSFQLAFADTAYDPTAGESRESQIDLSLPPEFHGQASDISRPDFSGSWVLDESASDDLKEATRAAQNKGPRPSRGDRGSGGRRGGRGPRPGGDGASSENSGEEGMSSRSK